MRTVDFSTLKGALPYIKAFRDKVFVMKLSGELCEAASNLDHLAEQIALLHFIGMKLVIVHGGGKHATRLGEKLGVDSKFVGGRRITSAEMLEVAKMSFAGTLNTDFIALFKKHGLSAVGLSGIDGELLTAKKRPPSTVIDPEAGEQKVDFGFVGDVVSTNVEVLSHLLDGGYLPVVCSLAADEKGQILNINADTLASRLAIGLKAEKLCFLGTVDGLMRDMNDPSTLYSLIDVKEAQKLIEDKIATAGMIPKLTTSFEALRNGVERVHIINGLSPDAVLQEIFTNEGAGTMIVRD